MDEKNNYPFVLNKMGAIRMSLIQEFRFEKYKEFGLRPVFHIRDKWNCAKFEKEDKVIQINGFDIKGISYNVLTDEEILTKYPDLPPQPTDEEINNYLKIEAEWIAEQILYECGWDEFEKQCKFENLSQEFHNKFRPCDSKDQQCHLLCPDMKDIKNCKRRFVAHEG